ncbi:VOC family protein [Phenylobacterium sp.]|jgi:catechol 2,3-dioxygenase-like lactoylglutathione lyase family enzyme|uniref:VOC family protein n=1 Tax=Phenylobacterium sp. TaxID=1871053 RepID=UPI002F41606D
MTTPRLTPHAYVLAVPDLTRTTAYFEHVLGFSRLWNDGDNWQALGRDGVRVMLGRCPDAIPPAELGDHSYFAYVEVSDLDGFHAEIAAKGALLGFPPRDQPWGRREMAVATPDGHRMMFANPIRA